MSRRDAWGRAALVVRVMPGVSVTYSPEQTVGLDEIVPTWAERELLGWTQGDLRPESAEWTARAMLMAGWPVASMWASYDLEPSSGYWWYKARNGYVIAPPPSEPNYAEVLTLRERVLPMRVAGGGFALCTAFWAVVWGAVLLGPPAARRAMRRMRGKCERCGYDRRGLVAGARCPECGWDGGQARPGI